MDTLRLELRCTFQIRELLYCIKLYSIKIVMCLLFCSYIGDMLSVLSLVKGLCNLVFPVVPCVLGSVVQPDGSRAIGCISYGR